RSTHGSFRPAARRSLRALLASAPGEPERCARPHIRRAVRRSEARGGPARGVAIRLLDAVRRPRHPDLEADAPAVAGGRGRREASTASTGAPGKGGGMRRTTAVRRRWVGLAVGLSLLSAASPATAQDFFGFGFVDIIADATGPLQLDGTVQTCVHSQVLGIPIAGGMHEDGSGPVA